MSCHPHSALKRRSQFWTHTRESKFSFGRNTTNVQTADERQPAHAMTKLLAKDFQFLIVALPVLLARIPREIPSRRFFAACSGVKASCVCARQFMSAVEFREDFQSEPNLSKHLIFSGVRRVTPGTQFSQPHRASSGLLFQL